MKINSLVRFSGGYGSDTFVVVAICKSGVAIKALDSTATLAKGEVTFAAASDLFVYRA